MYSKTAVVIFTRTAEEESRNKQFTVANKANNIAIAAAFIQHTVAIVKKSGLPYYIAFDKDQHGETFGQRLTNSIEEVYNKGYSRVIAIGNDCPNLTSGMLLDAAHRLETVSVVSGPAHDGGAYLIGLDVSVFDKKNLSELAWKSSHLFNSLMEWAEENELSYSKMRMLFDIDSVFDFALLCRYTHLHSSLSMYIQGLVKKLQDIFNIYKLRLLSLTYFSFRSLRAPTC